MAASAAPGSELYIGLMSGTSVDGVDAVLVDFAGATPAVLAHAHRRFDPDLRSELLSLCSSGNDEIERAALASLRLVAVYAECVHSALLAAGRSAADVRAIGAHGQTVRHRPDRCFTVQLNAPARLAELAGIDVVADFRSRDIAAGGEGAPLVPAFHAAVFASKAPRAVVNIGGISNVTYLPGSGQSLVGFDCGPGNVLLDLNAGRHLGQPMDRDGAWAQQGTVDEAVLARLMEEPFLDQPPPKSTGRELFSAYWLDSRLTGRHLAPADLQRTLTEFTARAVGSAIGRWCREARDVIVCGGGARNTKLMQVLAATVAPRELRTSEALGIPADQVEALAFAWLARRFIRREPGSVAEATGARGPRVLGALYPA
ncbi:MAG TPA: anhydro-N-acetylmuramic acid kinase [Burkholderiaceae bacterium]|nr:anhydro-N-acetylmuramic acid kinase [Burkholderiaceae bacterium]